ncbi:hypothetical protein C8J57DRAFT_1491396 [Mycena rebaudengoi]|nr:hypothetical protein C8J57DRAFT_1491396 [Mycena rebaudengoi]
MFGRNAVPAEAAWMFYQLSAFLCLMAYAQCEFVLRKCSDTFMLHNGVLCRCNLEYPEYNPHHTIDSIFASHRAPQKVTPIAICDSLPPTFNLKKCAQYWSEAERVVEAAILSLGRLGSTVEITTEKDGVVSISHDSIMKILANMGSVVAPIAVPFVQMSWPQP